MCQQIIVFHVTVELAYEHDHCPPLPNEISRDQHSLSPKSPKHPWLRKCDGGTPEFCNTKALQLKYSEEEDESKGEAEKKICMVDRDMDGHSG